MKKSSLLQDLTYGDAKPAVSVLLESDFTKEIRIALKKSQVMKEHQTACPIVVEVFRGSIAFGVADEEHVLGEGDIVSLPGAVPHNLRAIDDSVVRLTLSKGDSSERVKKVSEQ